MDKYIDLFPPSSDNQRFGNKSYRSWLKHVIQNSKAILNEVIQCNSKNKQNNDSLIEELATYLNDSFGNMTRIDYGTGHELNFIIFLLVLDLNGFFPTTSYLDLIGKVFAKYIDLVRKLLVTYKMEPAGSQGVWGLDDYHFLPFIFGSSQLSTHSNYTPSIINDVDVCKLHSQDYLFLSSIVFIHKMKTGPFAEHSNILYNISMLSDWSNVCRGLLKMYQAEVLSKFQIVQHIYFGEFFSFENALDKQGFHVPSKANLIHHTQ